MEKTITIKQKIIKLVKQFFKNVSVQKESSKNVIVNLIFDRFCLVVRQEDEHYIIELWKYYNVCIRFCINKKNKQINTKILNAIESTIKIIKSSNIIFDPAQDTEYISNSYFRNILSKINEYDRYQYICEAVMKEYLGWTDNAKITSSITHDIEYKNVSFYCDINNSNISARLFIYTIDNFQYNFGIPVELKRHNVYV